MRIEESAAVSATGGNLDGRGRIPDEQRLLNAGLIAYAAVLFDSGCPRGLAGDFNVVPIDEDIYNRAPDSKTHCYTLKAAIASRTS
jgi:hypothetical protein